MAPSEVQHEPDSPRSTRMKTWSKNATTHPGAILQDAQRVQRTKEEIAEAKTLKNLQMEAKVQKQNADKARKASGEVRIASLEGIEAIAAANAESRFPRHRGLPKPNVCVQ